MGKIRTYYRLMLLRLSVLTVEPANYSKIITRGSSFCKSIYDYFTLLKDFNKNTVNFHQYFKNKLSSHQPSHMHNIRHRTYSNFNTPLFNHSKTEKCYLYQVITTEQPTKFASKLHFPVQIHNTK